jgi:hypothetical protein
MVVGAVEGLREEEGEVGRGGKQVSPLCGCSPRSVEAACARAA